MWVCMWVALAQIHVEWECEYKASIYISSNVWNGMGAKNTVIYEDTHTHEYSVFAMLVSATSTHSRTRVSVYSYRHAHEKNRIHCQLPPIPEWIWFRSSCEFLIQNETNAPYNHKYTNIHTPSLWAKARHDHPTADQSTVLITCIRFNEKWTILFWKATAFCQLLIFFGDAVKIFRFIPWLVAMTELYHFSINGRLPPAKYANLFHKERMSSVITISDR